MRIIAGTFCNRRLIVPAGQATRPTAERLRQSVFDVLAHAPWAGADWLRGASVLDAFAGTGAMGLEALSRGAPHAVFMENGPAALAALRANIAACDVASRARVLATDVLHPPAPGDGRALVFLDPPYGEGLLPAAVQTLRDAGWIASGSLLVAEESRLERNWFFGVKLAQKVHGAGQVNVWREP